MNNAIIVQQATGDYRKLLELTYPWHSFYARVHQMDYVVFQTPMQTSRHPYWDKIASLFTAYKIWGHKYVFWLDADCLIHDASHDLREALSEDKWIGLTRWAHEGLGFAKWCPDWHFNCGAIYLRMNNPQAISFLQTVWNTDDKGHEWHDQAAILTNLAPESPFTFREGLQEISLNYNYPVALGLNPQVYVAAWHGQGTSHERHAKMAQVLEGLMQQEIKKRK